MSSQLSSGLKSVRKALDKSIEYVGSALLLLVTLISIVQVILRYVFDYAIIWGEEGSRFLFIWVVMLGAVLGLSQGKHMIIKVIPSHLPPKVAAWIALPLQLLALVFLCVVAFKGLALLSLTKNDYYVTLPFPVMYAYLAAVVGAALMIFYWLFEIMATIHDLVATPTENE